MHGTFSIGNLASADPAPEGVVDVPVDRTSALGNPYLMGPMCGAATHEDAAMREAVCDAYDDLLRSGAEADIAAIGAKHGCVDIAEGFDGAAREAALHALSSRAAAGESMRLMCWCWPKRCHSMSVAKRVCELLPPSRAGDV